MPSRSLPLSRSFHPVLSVCLVFFAQTCTGDYNLSVMHRSLSLSTTSACDVYLSFSLWFSSPSLSREGTLSHTLSLSPLHSHSRTQSHPLTVFPPPPPSFPPLPLSPLHSPPPTQSHPLPVLPPPPPFFLSHSLVRALSSASSCAGFSSSHSHSILRPISFLPAFSRSCSLSLSLALSFSISLSLSLSRALSELDICHTVLHTLSLTHTLSHSLTLSLSQYITLPLSRLLAHSLPFSRALSALDTCSAFIQTACASTLFLSLFLSLFRSFALSLSLSLPHTRTPALSLARALCIRYILCGYSNSALSHTHALSRFHTHTLVFPYIRYVLCGYENWVLSHILSLPPIHTIHLFCVRYMLCGYADGAISITDVEDTPRGAHTKFETVMAHTHANTSSGANTRAHAQTRKHAHRHKIQNEGGAHA